MPSYYNDILVVSSTELVEEFGFFSSKQQLSKKVYRHEKRGYGLKKVRSGKGLGNELLIEFDSLPRWQRDKIGDPRKIENPLQKYYVESAAAYRYYTNDFTYPDGSSLEPNTQEQLTVNASVMEAAIKLYDAREKELRDRNKATRSLLRTVHNDVTHFNTILEKREEQLHNLPTSYAYFKARFEGFKEAEEPYRSLIKDAQGTSKKNAEKCDESHKELLFSLFADSDTKPNLTKVAFQYDAFLSGDFDIINKETGELLKPDNYRTLSLSTIKAELTAFDSVGVRSKRSLKDYNFKYQHVPHHSFERPTFAGSIISVDDRNPPFWYDNNRSRMWWYLGVDIASGMITTWVYGKSKKGIILDFYRQMVRQYHMFGWKMPYEIEFEKSLNDSYKNTFLKPGAMFEYPRMLISEPRGKRAERSFREIRYDLEKDRIGWIARPNSKDESNQPSTLSPKIIPYDKLVNDCLEDIETINNMPHFDNPKMSRAEYAFANQNPDLPETNYKSILLHLGYDQETSVNAGLVKLQYKEFCLGDNGQMSVGEELIRKMQQLEGETIQVKWLDDNYGQVLKAMVYDDGRYICELIAKPKPQRAEIEKTPEDRRLFAQFKKYEETISAYIKMQEQKIVGIGTIDRTTKRVSNTFKINRDVVGYQARESTPEVIQIKEINEDFENESSGSDYRSRKYNDHLIIK